MTFLHSVFQSVSNIPQTNRAHGIDISKYDKFFNPETATAQLDFVIQRISYGIRQDEAFGDLVDGVMRVPIRGGYHYLSSGGKDCKTTALSPVIILSSSMLFSRRGLTACVSGERGRLTACKT